MQYRLATVKATVAEIEVEVQLGDVAKRFQSDECKPTNFLVAAPVLLPISLVLQFVHVILMILHTKPNKQFREDNPEEYTTLMLRYRKKLVAENILAVIIILLNIIISYTIIEQIKAFNISSCTF